MTARSLIKTTDFLSQVQATSRQAERLVEAIAGAEFTILRHPEWGMAVRGTGYSSWPIHPTDNTTFKIIYSFDDRKIVLRALYPAVPPGSR